MAPATPFARHFARFLDPDGDHITFHRIHGSTENA